MTKNNIISDPTVLINIVLYNPNQNKLLELIHICLQYDQAKILLFDNATSSTSIECTYFKQVILFKSPENVGVAGAHYYACKMAEKENLDFVLFLDQDSQLPSNFVSSMIAEFYRLKKLHPRLSAIGPSWRDPRIYNWYHERNDLRDKVKERQKKNF